MKRRLTILLILATLGGAGLLRTVWLTADPPADHTVGIVWHDEGAWVHNARNRVLWGEWRTDEWNPMYLAPVFTGMEYAAFRAFGVGTWQARTVPVLSGLVAVAALWWGLSAVADRRTALVGMALLATNFFFVMWNRAALMESTLTMWIVLAWAAYAQAQRRPAWGLAAGTAAVLAFFTKASAVFFAAALGLEAGVVLLLGSVPVLRVWTGAAPPPAAAMRASVLTIAGLGAAAAIALVVFVAPQWTEFRFYNWQMSVLRKPAYTLAAFAERASWLPVIHDVLSRMWMVLAMSAIAVVAIAGRWWTTPSAGRLLALWVLLGIAELVVHDTGNERRYVMLVPAFVALAAWQTGGRARGPREEGFDSGWTRLAAVPVVLLAAYLVWGSVVRLASIDAIYDGDLAWTVRVSAALAGLTTAVWLWQWRRLSAVASRRWPTAVLVPVIAVVIALDLVQFRSWASTRTDLNYQASRALAQALPPGTLVHGKLANGLALETLIKPVFVGRGFGNYADRFTRPDVRYLLTYILPSLAFEGDVLEEVVRAYPGHRIIQIFKVNETPGEDVAALIEK